MFDIAWETVQRIVTRVVGERLPKDRLKGLEYIVVDETSYKRGHRYITVISDLMTARVVWMAKGKSAETLAGFSHELGPKGCRQIRLVAMDMSDAYANAVREHAPQADIVYDRYHVVRLLLDAIDEVRRDEVRRLEGDARKALKNTRFPLLRNPGRHLSPRDRDAIQRVRATNQRLWRAYELRCDFEELWELEYEAEAREFIMNWTRSALLSRRQPLRRVARTLRKYIDGILGSFRWWGTTSAVQEGTNSKIKLAIHRPFGFHSIDALISMVYLCCGGITCHEDFGFGEETHKIDKEWSYFEVSWKPKSWKSSFRVIVYRRRRKVARKGPIQLDHLFEPFSWEFEYKAVMTNKTESAKAVLRYHNGRGSQEGVFAEMKSHSQMDYVPTRRLVGNQVFTLLTVLAHNLNRELQMRVAPPTRNTTMTRACLWVFEKIGTFRHRLIQRAGRLTRPNGKATLTLSANPQAANEIQHILSQLQAA